jgi:hypothetical protein
MAQQSLEQLNLVYYQYIVHRIELYLTFYQTRKLKQERLNDEKYYKCDLCVIVK